MASIVMEQGTEEWLQWRKSKITASELPIILGLSKWCTPYLLWERKLGFAPEQEDNYAMKRGRDLEPIVRETINQDMGTKFVPKVVVSEQFPWAAASLDGIDELCNAILEIKCPGLVDHQKAEKGEIPEHYYPQIQWQLVCSGMDVCYYVSHYNDEEVIEQVKRDDAYINDVLVPAAEAFYKNVVEMQEPEKNDKDYIEIVNDEFDEYARQWRAAKEMHDIYKEKEEFFKQKMVECANDHNCKGCGLKLSKIKRDGSVDWKTLWKDLSDYHADAAAQFPPDHYRKDSTTYWKVTEESCSKDTP